MVFINVDPTRGKKILKRNCFLSHQTAPYSIVLEFHSLQKRCKLAPLWVGFIPPICPHFHASRSATLSPSSYILTFVALTAFHVFANHNTMTAISLYFDKLRFSTSYSLFLNILLKNFPSHLQGEEKKIYWNRIQEAPTGVCICKYTFRIVVLTITTGLVECFPRLVFWIFIPCSFSCAILHNITIIRRGRNLKFLPTASSCMYGHHITYDPEVTKIEYAWN